MVKNKFTRGVFFYFTFVLGMMMTRAISTTAEPTSKKAKRSLGCRRCEKSGLYVQLLNEDDVPSDRDQLYALRDIGVLCGRCCWVFKCIGCGSFSLETISRCDKAHQYCSSCCKEETWPDMFYQGEAVYCFQCFPVGVYLGDMQEQSKLLRKPFPLALTKGGEDLVAIICSFLTGVDEHAYCKLCPHYSCTSCYDAHQAAQVGRLFPNYYPPRSP